MGCRLYYTVSFDGGRNWRKPQIIPGSELQANGLGLHLKNNVLHLFYGRRNDSDPQPGEFIFYRKRSLAPASL